MKTERMIRGTGIGLALVMAAGLLPGCSQGDAETVSVSEIQEAVLPEEQDLTLDYTSPDGLVVEPGAYVAVVVKGIGENTYWDIIRQGVEAAVSDVNDAMGFQGDDRIRLTFEGPSEEGNEEEQINTLDTVLAENPTVLCLAAIDMQSCQPQLEAARDNEIPVLILDAGIESDLVTAVCQTDNYAAGKEAGQRMAEKLQGQGKVALVCHQPETETCKLRSEGFQKVLEEYEDIEVVAVLEDTGDVTMEEQLEALKQQYPDLDGLFATNESNSDLILELYKEEEKLPVIIGFDNGAEQIEAIRQGLEYGCICQNPYSMGYAVVIAALHAAAGDEIDSAIDTGFAWIDQTNIDDEDKQIYLYQ